MLTRHIVISVAEPRFFSLEPRRPRRAFFRDGLRSDQTGQ